MSPVELNDRRGGKEPNLTTARRYGPLYYIQYSLSISESIASTFFWKMLKTCFSSSWFGIVFLVRVSPKYKEKTSRSLVWDQFHSNQRPNPNKNMVHGMGPYSLTLSNSTVDYDTFIMGNPMPESTLTLCQSRLYPPIRDFGVSLCWTFHRNCE